MEQVDITIIGGGLGVVMACYFAEHYPALSTLVLEKNKHLGEEQTGHSSGVRHAGFLYSPDSTKALLCVEGHKQQKEFCQRYDIACEDVGKCTIATNPSGIKMLEHYLDNALRSGIPATILSRDELKSLEPNVEGLAALYTPTTGILDVASYIQKKAALARQYGAEILTSSEVVSIHRQDNGFILDVQNAQEQYSFYTHLLFNMAGLQAQKIGKMINADFPYELKILRGEYMKFNRNSRPELHVGRNIYPVPRPIPGLYDQGRPKMMVGTHLTPTFEMDAQGKTVIGNTVIVGPLAELVASSDSAIRKPAQAFQEDIKNILPSLNVNDLQEDHIGHQVKILGHADFVIETDPDFPQAVHIICDSPGITAGEAIPNYVKSKVLGSQLERLVQKKEHNL